ncbi:MAG: TetR/AcrR family transcriptional regulator [Coriobacteriales bacterium]|jgi:AcrR family transcriptional regulator|nr:TetR/AcrR family transcriptional regulator [Coriobacteriales bacterium]
MPKDFRSNYEQFQRIDAARREHILSAALQEIARHDYPQVSTNTIVKRAGISKGLLFHYFGSKEGLFRYLLDDIFATYTNMVLELSGGDSPQPKDIFEILRLALSTQLELTRRYLLETRFYVRAIKGELPAELREHVDSLVEQSWNTMAALTEALDENLLKEGVSRQQAARILGWISEGLSNEILAEITPDLSEDDFQRLVDQSVEYFELMRCLLYRADDEPAAPPTASAAAPPPSETASTAPPWRTDDPTSERMKDVSD